MYFKQIQLPANNFFIHAVKFDTYFVKSSHTAHFIAPRKNEVQSLQYYLLIDKDFGLLISRKNTIAMELLGTPPTTGNVFSLANFPFTVNTFGKFGAYFLNSFNLTALF